MRHLLSVLTIALGLGAGESALAQSDTTVVELYTSQGCSSCPPADEVLNELATRDNVIALSLHVDYWDYIGWADDLANPAFTRRQKAFNHAAGGTTVYTPQMIIGGVDQVVGSHPMQVMDIIQAHNANSDPVTVQLSRSGAFLDINALAQPGLRGDFAVQLVRYAPQVVRDITRGENAGKTIVYKNVVTAWDNLGSWNSADRLTMRARISGSDPVVVIIQDGTDGPIMGAAQLR
jgi:hypothetical protein